MVFKVLSFLQFFLTANIINGLNPLKLSWKNTKASDIAVAI